MSVATDEADLSAAVSEGLSERLCRSYGWFVIAVAMVIAYFNTFMVPFVFDGTNYIVDNVELHDLGQPRRVLEFSPTRAVGYFTFALNCALSRKLSATGDGFDPRSWHVVNLSIHILAAWTLWGLARRGFRSPKLGGRYAGASEQLALAVALLWALHPLCTQAVTYLYQRVESLMGLFLLLTIYCAVRFAELQSRVVEADGLTSENAGELKNAELKNAEPENAERSDDAEPRPAGRILAGLAIWPALSVLFCLAGMATKETMLVAPIIAVWYDRVFIARSWRELLDRRAFLYLALFGCWSLLLPLMFITPYSEAGINDHRHDTPLTYFLNETKVILHYFRLVVIPWGQNIDYAWQRAVIIPAYQKPEADPAYLRDTFLATWPWLTALSGLGLATLYAVIRRPAIGFLGATVFVTLAPTSSFVVIIDLIFEHRMYVPLMACVALIVVAAYEAIGLTAGLGELFDRFGRRIFRLGMLLGRLVKPISFLGRKVRRVGSFVCRRGKSLSWHDETITTVRTSLAWLTVALLIALTLRRNSDYQSHITIWADAFAKAPHNARAAYNHGVFLQGDTGSKSLDMALEQYYATLTLDPNYDGAHLNLANVFNWKATLPENAPQRQRLLVDAEHHYHELLRIKPGDDRGMFGLADVLRQQQRWQEAAGYVNQLLATNPEHEQGLKLKADIPRAAYNNGIFLQNDKGPHSLDLALEQYKITLALDPNYDGAHLNLANLYAWKATLPENAPQRQNLLDAAEHHYGELLHIKPGDERGLFGLADVLRHQQRWEEAEDYVDQLLATNPQHEQGRKLKADIARERPQAGAAPSGK